MGSRRPSSGEYLVNIGQGRRAAQKRVTGGRWRRIVLGHVLAEQVGSPHRGGSPRLWPEVAGVLAATAPALGMPSGKIGHHPGWKPEVAIVAFHRLGRRLRHKAAPQTLLMIQS
eukprot:scaffold109998_cov59-Phaeocystis_antarctica.AAC.2